MEEERKSDASGRSNDFGKRLERAQASIRSRDREQLTRGSAYSFGIRVATEMAVAVGVGFAFGWFLDKWLGTRPWLLLLCLPLGAAAGILNVMRAARTEADRQQAEMTRRNFDAANREESDTR